MKVIAFKATYSDWKLIKTRGVVQIVMEVPLADAHAAYEVLGGMPDYSSEVWFAIAPLKVSPAAKEPAATPEVAQPPLPAKRNWLDLPPSQQAGIRCDDPIFAAFLKEQRPDDWHESPDPVDCVYLICGITSRSELGTQHASRMIWKALDDQFQVWKMKERVGA